MEPAEINPKSIGNNIRKERISKQIKQEHLAKESRISISEISRIENGHRDTSVKKLIRIATVLQVHPADLLRAMFLVFVL